MNASSYQTWILRYFDRQHECALITGGSSGIGLEYLRLLAAEGCRCLVVSNEPDRFETVREELHADGITAPVEFIDCDLTDDTQLQALEARLDGEAVGILVNNAGFGLKGRFTELPREAYRSIVAVNALAPVLLSRCVLRGMAKRGRGLHISVASINVASPMPKNAVYTATKHLVWSYSLAVAQEFADSDIRFQIMLPGTTDTPFHVKQGVNPGAMVMQPADVARRSLERLDQLIHIPNTADRWMYPLGSRLPLGLRMRIASWLMKKRLGI